ncbi:MAG: hypothetical protein Tsb0021_06430 [Chlamydiales bacterium]
MVRPIEEERVNRWLDWQNLPISEVDGQQQEAKETVKITPSGLPDAFPLDVMQRSSDRKDEFFSSTAIRSETITPELQDALAFESAIKQASDLIAEEQRETGKTLEQILLEVFKDQEILKSEMAALSQGNVKDQQEEYRKVSEERQKHIREAIEKAQSTQTWARYQATLGTLQNLLAIGTGTALLAVPGAEVIGALMIAETVDSLLGDVVKKKMVEGTTYLLPMEEETKKSWNSSLLTGLKLGIAATELLLSFKIPAVAQSDVQGFIGKAINYGYNALTGGKMVADGTMAVKEHQGRVSQGDLVNIDFRLNEKREKVDSAGKQLKKLFEEFTQNRELMIKIMENQQSTAINIFRS